MRNLCVCVCPVCVVCVSVRLWVGSGNPSQASPGFENLSRPARCAPGPFRRRSPAGGSAQCRGPHCRCRGYSSPSIAAPRPPQPPSCITRPSPEDGQRAALAAGQTETGQVSVADPRPPQQLPAMRELQAPRLERAAGRRGQTGGPRSRTWISVADPAGALRSPAGGTERVADRRGQRPATEGPDGAGRRRPARAIVGLWGHTGMESARWRGCPGCTMPHLHASPSCTGWVSSTAHHNLLAARVGAGGGGTARHPSSSGRVPPHASPSSRRGGRGSTTHRMPPEGTACHPPPPRQWPHRTPSPRHTQPSPHTHEQQELTTARQSGGSRRGRGNTTRCTPLNATGLQQ